jgi:hypothetical protein
MSSDLRDDTGHGRFREMCALAASGGLTADELAALKTHLQKCEICRETLSQYRVLGTQGLPVLAGSSPGLQESHPWDDSASWTKLIARLRADEKPAVKTTESVGTSRPGWLRRVSARWFTRTRRNKPSSGSI